MAQQAKPERKETIPKKAQIILLVIGIPLLLYAVLSAAKSTGLMGGPKIAAKPASKAKGTKAGSAAGGAATTTTPGAAAAGTSPGPEETKLPDTPLADIQLAVRDPFSSPDLVQAPPPTAPPGSGPRRPGGGPSGPRPPVIKPPVIKPPAGGAPPPTTGGTNPPETTPPANGGQQTPPTPAATRPPVPAIASLAELSPALRQPAFRGRQRNEQGVRLVGTVRGAQGSVAVLSDTSGTGRTSRYVQPGDVVGERGREVKAVGAGEVTLTGPYRTTQTLTVGERGGTPRQGMRGRSGEVP